uniref:Uncharacterized protein n=1 Tax=Romanomermis culicivorax TaxID=13658 RepID=A0A915I5S3_ROMCU
MSSQKATSSNKRSTGAKVYADLQNAKYEYNMIKESSTIARSPMVPNNQEEDKDPDLSHPSFGMKKFFQKKNNDRNRLLVNQPDKLENLKWIGPGIKEL